MKRAVPYAAVKAFLEALELEPAFVREVRVRAPRSIEVLVYARNADGDKHLGDAGGVALEARTLHIETLSDDPELRDGMRVAEQISDLYVVPDLPKATEEEASGK